MPKLTLLLLLLLTPALQAADKELIVYRISEVTFGASVVADWTSGATLDKDKFYEANPLLTQNSGAQAAIMGGISVATWYGTRRLYKEGKKKTAIIIMLAGTALHGWAAYHNMTLEGR